MGEGAITAEMNLEALQSFVASTPETIAWKTLEARWHILDLPFMEIISCCGESVAITSDTDRFKTFRDLCERAHSAASNITSAEFPEDCTEGIRRAKLDHRRNRLSDLLQVLLQLSVSMLSYTMLCVSRTQRRGACRAT